MINNPVKLKLLLVDDETHVLNKVQKIIDDNFDDFEIVQVCKDGLSALTYLQSNSVDILITDIRMPEKSGLDLADELKILDPDIKVVILTGYNQFDYAKRAIQLKVVDILLKPVIAEDLIKVLTELLISFSIERSELNHLSSPNHFSPQESFEAVRKIITENFDEDVTLADIAEKFNFSQAYLTKLFIKYAGVSPLKFRTDIRLNKAKEYLISTDMTIAEIADKLNYSDQFAFSKAFKKHIQVSPVVYRKGNKKG